MIHTIYSNSYEVLRAVLLSNVQALNFGQPTQNQLFASVFDRVPIIVPTSAVRDDLERHIAQKFSICASMDFLFLSQWMGFYAKDPLTNVVGNEADWMIWEILRDTSATSFRAHLQKLDPSCRLLSYLAGKSDEDLLALSRHISQVFVSYTSYRLDWVFSWLDLHSELVPDTPWYRQEQARIQSHPDYLWQRELWRHLALLPQWKGREFLKELPHALLRLASVPESATQMEMDDGRWVQLPQALHIFMPFVVPPLMLPILKAYAQTKRDIWLYLLNPCAQYWFDWAPKSLFDLNDTHANENAFLMRNGLSTRANIDRLWRFTAEAEVNSPIVLTENDEHEALGQVPLSVQAPQWFQSRAAARDTAAAGVFFEDFKDIQVDSAVAMQSYYLEAREEALLRRLQDAVLNLSAIEPLANGALWAEGDDSLCFMKAPSAVRELEGIVDYLHHRFATDATLKPDDVLVATPDITANAPLIEKVFGALSAERHIDYRIMGVPRAFQDEPTMALLTLLKLLNSRATIEDFEAWLSLPSVAKTYELSADDVQVMKTWLHSAGYRYGFNEAHLKRQLAEQTLYHVLDFHVTLVSALFLLSQAFAGVDAQAFSHCGNEEGGFATVMDHEVVFLKLLAIYQDIQEVLKPLERTSATMDEWIAWLLQVMARFLPPENSLNSYDSIRHAAHQINEEVSYARAKTSAPIEISFSIFIDALESKLKTARAVSSPTSAVTFTSLSALRGLPYRVIVIWGLSQSSQFPGTLERYEFDLMTMAPRRGDRDARVDNRNVFLDLILAARSHVLISYTCGANPATPEAPSILYNELLDYVLSQEPDYARRQAMHQALEVSLAKLSFSAQNFVRQAQAFQSTHATLLRALQERAAKLQQGLLEAPPLFGDRSLLTEGDLTLTPLTIQAMYQFLRTPSTFVFRQAGVRLPTVNRKIISTYEGVQDSLSKWLYKDLAFKRLLNGQEDSKVLMWASFSPHYGIRALREVNAYSDLKPIMTYERLVSRALAGYTKCPSKLVEVTLSTQQCQSQVPIVIRERIDNLYTRAGAETSATLIAHTVSQQSSASQWRHLLTYLLLNASGVRASMDLYFMPPYSKSRPSEKDRQDCAQGYSQHHYEPVLQAEAQEVLAMLWQVMRMNLRVPGAWQPMQRARTNATQELDVEAVASTLMRRGQRAPLDMTPFYEALDGYFASLRQLSAEGIDGLRATFKMMQTSLGTGHA